jgi:dTDP-4-amino-4,6-dideoxygalactose transaminase
VPFFDLASAHAACREEILRGVAAIIDSGSLVNGPEVLRFEEMFAEWCGTARCVGVASGLDALRLGLLAAGAEPGDEVVVPANTFVATFEAVTQANAVPVLVDVSELDYNLDVAAVEAALTPQTRFLLPVHLYGQMADMRALQALADHRGVAVIEDACQAHGASRDGVRAGASGIAAAFSFYPSKNLGAMGDAGAVVTESDDVAAAVRMLREHGQPTRYVHDREGYTARLDTVQALVLLTKLPYVNRWNGERRRAASFYSAALAGVGDLRLPAVPHGSDPVWHLYVVRTAAPVQLVEALARCGIATGRHYPVPAHLSAAYAHLGYGRGSFPVAETLAREVVSLPIYPGISDEQLEAVATAIRAFFADGWPPGE